MQNLKRDNLIFGRYRLQQSLGKGSFGEVFYAEDIQFDPPRAVAFKLLHPQYTSDPQVREDLKREAGVLARFDHPNILNVLDFGITEEIAFIVMELAQGGSLARRLRPDPTKPAIPMALPDVATYLDQMADALDEAHDQGLIHRDIKPQNILLDRRGRILVADFGLATAVTGSSSSVMVDTSGSGTPLYMSPEQWQGRAGRASDIYSLGAVVFQMVCGFAPYHGNQFELFGQHLNNPVPRLSDRAPGLVYPPALDDVLAQAMAKDPRQRIRPAKELARAFRAAMEVPPNSQPTVGFMPVQRPPMPSQNTVASIPLQPNRPMPPANNPPVSNTNYQPGTGSGSSSNYQPGTGSGSNYQPGPGSGTNYQPGSGSGTNYQPNNFNQPNQPPRPYENRPNTGSNPPGTYQGGNPSGTNSFPPYSGPSNQSQSVPPHPAAGIQPNNTPSYPVSGSQPRPAPATPPVIPANQKAVTNEKKGIPTWVWPVALLVVLLIAAIAVFAVLNLNKNTPPGTDTAQVTVTPAGGVTTAPSTTSVPTTGGSATTAPVTTPAVTTAATTGSNATTQASTTSASDTTAVVTTAPATTPPATTSGPTPTPVPYGGNITTFQAQNDIVLGMAYSPDGKTLATASEDSTIKLWDIATNQLKATLSGHTGPVRAIAFSPNGKYLVSGSADKTARVWDLSNNTSKFTLSGQSGTITSVAFNPDSNSLATGSDDHSIFLWKLENGQKFGATFKNPDNVTAIAYSPDGKTLAGGSRDGVIKLWDLVSTNEKPALNGAGHTGTIWSLVFSHDGKLLASGSLDKTTRLWNVVDNKLSYLYDDSTQGIRQVAFSPDDQFLATACDDKTVYIWNTRTGIEETTLTGHTKEVYSVAWSPDGKTVASGGADGVVKLWNLVKS